jgi:hypothetical protein
LIYLRARTYDPATAQFLSVDPFESITGEPYSYVGDNPLNEANLMAAVALPASVASCSEASLWPPVLERSSLEALLRQRERWVQFRVVSGVVAAGVDVKGCAARSGASCVGAVVGGIASAGAGAVASGAVTGTAAAGTMAISLTASGISFLGDVADALASPNTSNSSSESGCG